MLGIVLHGLKRVHIEGLEHLNDNRDRGILLLGTHSTLLDAGGAACTLFLIWMWCIDLKIILSWISSFIVVALGFIKPDCKRQYA